MDKTIAGHVDVLEKYVFQTEAKWPQFKLLINDLLSLEAECENTADVISLERTLLYGGNSLVGPIFDKCNFSSIDVSPTSADQRGPYNLYMTEHPGFQKVKYSVRADIDTLELEEASADLILIPNLVHHVKNNKRLLQAAYKALRPGGRVYIFEALVRELHQEPDDYIRFTPYGLKILCESIGFKTSWKHTTGGAFQVLSYVIEQCLECVPESEKGEVSKLLYGIGDIKELEYLDHKYPKNLVRKNTSFPIAFSYCAMK